MIIKHTNAKTFDVFFNEGWENWGRFSINNNKLTHIGGTVVIPPNIINYLKKRYGVA